MRRVASVIVSSLGTKPKASMISLAKSSTQVTPLGLTKAMNFPSLINRWATSTTREVFPYPGGATISTTLFEDKAVMILSQVSLRPTKSI